MKVGVRRMMGAALVLSLLALPAWVRSAAAADFVLGPEDVISVSVWLHPELERTVTVSAGGTITYPPLGEVQAAGLTPKQLGDRLGERLSTFLRQTTAVTVTVTQFMSNSVFVNGAVARPGRYGFEHLPGLMDVISQAGGAMPGADLGHVQVIHKEGQARGTVIADVASALRNGVGVPLPVLKPGDTVVVPATGLPGMTSGGEGVGVLGEVNKPGIYPVAEGQDLWAMLAVAGGLTQHGDLGNVNVITRQGVSQAVVTVNLRDALRRGGRAPFIVRSGDVVFVASNSATGAGQTYYAFQQVLQVSQNLLNLLVIRNILKK